MYIIHYNTCLLMDIFELQNSSYAAYSVGNSVDAAEQSERTKAFDISIQIY